jgi:hypothetical protein
VWFIQLLLDNKTLASVQKTANGGGANILEKHINLLPEKSN